MCIRDRLSSSVIDAILKTFLANSAGFVKYLDAVEPFSTQELTAFAEEVGLSVSVSYEPMEPLHRDSPTGALKRICSAPLPGN